MNDSQRATLKRKIEEALGCTWADLIELFISEAANQVDTGQAINRQIMHDISLLLQDLGIFPRLVGYQYLRECIFECIQNHDVARKNVTQHLYPSVAKIYRKSEISIIRGMGYAIKASWNSRNETFNEVFGCISRKPTHSKFIFTVADYLQLQHNYPIAQGQEHQGCS